MVNVNTEQKSIDWFAINFDEFTKRLEAAKEAKSLRDTAVAQMELCEARECGHPPFKKDGTPHKGRECDHPDAMGYGRGTDICNSLYWEYGQLWEFFAAVGLMGGEDE